MLIDSSSFGGGISAAAMGLFKTSKPAEISGVTGPWCIGRPWGSRLNALFTRSRRPTEGKRRNVEALVCQAHVVLVRRLTQTPLHRYAESRAATDTLDEAIYRGEEGIYMPEKSSAQFSERIDGVGESIWTPEMSADAVEKSIYTPEERADGLGEPADTGEEPIYTVEDHSGTPETWIVGLEKSSVAVEESAG